MAGLRLSIDPTGVKTGASVVERELDEIKRKAGQAEGALDKTGTGGERAMASLGKATTKAAAALGALAASAVAAMSLRQFITATSEAEAVQAQLAAAIQSTGGVAGRSVADLNASAAALQRVTKFGDEATNAMQAVLLTFTNVRGDQFDRATVAVQDLATRMRTDLSSAALQVGKALNDPILGITALGRAGVQFSPEQQKVIKLLAETGRVAEAQTIILAELETQFGGSARAARETLGGALTALGNAWGDLFELAGPASEGLRQSIERLIASISSPGFVGAIQTVGAALFTMADTAASAIAALVDNADLLAISLGVLAASYIPAAVSGLGGMAAWLATSEGLFIAGAVAARGLSLAMSAIPFVAVVAGATTLYRLITAETEAINAQRAARDQLNASLNTYAATSAVAARDAALQLARAEEAAAVATLATLEAMMSRMRASVADTTGRERDRRMKAIEGLEGPLTEAQKRADGLRRTIAGLMREFATGEPAVTGATGGLGESLSGMTAATFAAIPPMRELREEYGNLALVMRDVMQANNDLAAADASRAYLAAVDSVVALSTELQTAGHWTEGLNRAISVARDADGFENQANAALMLAQQVASAAGGAEYLNGNARKVYESLLASAQSATLLASAANGVDFNSAVAQATELARVLGISLATATQLAATGYGNAMIAGGDGRGSQRSGVADANAFVDARNRSAADRRAAEYQASLLGGGAGGGAGQTADAYDQLLSSLDPVVRATQEFAAAQTTINAALATGRITAEEAAHAYSLAKDEFDKATASVSEAASVWASFESAGASAIDKLIAGTGNLRDSLIEVVQQLILAIANQRIMASGGKAVSSVGGLVMNLVSGFLGGGKGFAGMFDAGGTIPVGSSGIVGENGRELVRSTSHGAVVTSRADTARMGAQQSVPVVITGEIGVTVDDEGKIKAYVQRMGAQAAQQGAQAAVGAVKSQWGAINRQYSMDGVVR